MIQAGTYILIIPEGWCEYNYAQALKNSLPLNKQRSINIVLPKPTNENKALQLFRRAQKMIQRAKENKNNYDMVWIIFDNDQQPGLDKFFQQQSKTSIKIAYSSICIEHWFILHFEDNRQSFPSAKQATERIENLWKREFHEQYHKTKIKHFERLQHKLPDAIERAKAIQLQAEADNKPLENRNPYFTIHEFVQFFKQI